MFQMRANIVAMGVIGAALLLPELAQAEQVGHASWYALHSRTASGEMMNPSAMTAAHRSLPFGTKVLVENLSNGKSVVVRINDRGPFIEGRIIDVSKAAASVLGMLGSGTARVKVSASGGGSLKVARRRGPRQGRNARPPKWRTPPATNPRRSEDTPVKSAKMEGAPASKPVKVANRASPPRCKRISQQVRQDGKGSSKPAKIVTASAGKRSVKSEKRVAGLMKSTRDIKRVASRASSRKTYAVVSRSGARKAVTVASREFGKGRRGEAKASLWPRPPTPMEPSCAARASSTDAGKSHGGPGRPSPLAQTPGQGPAFDLSQEACGCSRPCSALVIIAVPCRALVRLVVAFPRRSNSSTSCTRGTTSNNNRLGSRGSCLPLALRAWGRRGQGADGPDDRPGCNNS